MRDDADTLGGRTTLLEPAAMSAPQRALYDYIDEHMVPWAQKSGFKAKLGDGRLIGPFNTLLLTPEIGQAFLDLQAAEGEKTSLSARVRQVVILAVGAAFESDYERYAHRAVAVAAGFSVKAAERLAEAEGSEELNLEEQVAQRFALALSDQHRVDQALFEEAKSIFGERGIADLIMLCGCYYTVSSMLNVFEVPVPD